MFATRLRFLLLTTVLFINAAANWNDTSTGVDLRKLPHFPLTKIRSGLLRDGSRITFEGITATAIATDRREALLTGATRSGKRWRVHISSLDEIWRGDLDGNGTQDYVFFTVGPYGNGRTAPPFSLSFLLMDADGLPVPFFTTIYHGENGDGIRHLTDLDHDGRAELLDSSYDEHVSDTRAEFQCSGHWTTQLYRFKDAHVSEFRGTIAGLTFPFVKPWSDRGCPAMEKPYRMVQPATLIHRGTNPTEDRTTSIRAVRPAGWLRIDAVAGCTSIRPEVIVYDRPHLREIAFPILTSDSPDELADAIRRTKRPVTISGLDKWGQGDCTASILWARSHP